MTNRMECVLYHNPIAIKHLDAAGIQDDGESLVVELSYISILAPVFDMQNKQRAGLVGLLGDESRIAKLVQKDLSIKNPVVLAAHPVVAVQSTMAAFAVLSQIASNYKRVVVMIHLSEARKFAYALQLMEGFTFLVDRSEPVPLTLPTTARLLANLRLIDSDLWNGIITFARSEKAQSSQRVEMWETMHAEYGSRCIAAV